MLTAGRDGLTCHTWGYAGLPGRTPVRGLQREGGLQDGSTCRISAGRPRHQPLAPRLAISILPTKAISIDPHHEGIYRIAPYDIALYIISVDEARSVFGSSVSESTHCGPILPDAPAYLRGPREA